MSKPHIELFSNKSGDWEVLRLNLGEDFIAVGHSISGHHWIELLETLGYEVNYKEISDENMEEGNY